MTAMEIHTSPVDHGTLPGLVRSVAELFAEDGGRRDPHMDASWPERCGVDYYSALLADEASLCLLASRLVPGTPPVGHLVGRLRRPDTLRPGAVTAVLESMRVDPRYRRGGVGASLARHFSHWARRQGANELSVTAYYDNRAAVEFYHAQGFHPFELTLHA